MAHPVHMSSNIFRQRKCLVFVMFICNYPGGPQVVLAAATWPYIPCCLQGNGEFGIAMFSKLMATISMYEALARSLMAYVACATQRRGLHALFSAFDQVCYEDGIVPYEQPLRRWLKLSTITAFLITACNISVMAYGMFGPQDIRQLFDVYTNVHPGQ